MAAAAAVEPVLTNISEMIDLAIGTPENGVVDFNMLQAVLHCLAQQLRVLGKNVELRGNAAVMPVGRVSDDSQTIAITEFIVDTEVPGKLELATSSVTSEQESVLVVERKKRTEVPPPVPKVAREAASKERKKGKRGTAGQSPTSSETPPVVVAPPPPAPPGQAAPPPPGQAPAWPPGQAPPAPPGQASAWPPGQAPPAPPGQASPAPPGQGPPAPPGQGPPAPPGQAPPVPPGQAPPPPPGQAPPGQAPPAPPVPPSLAQLAPRSVPSPTISKERLSLVTLSKFNILENLVLDLKDRVYGTSPKNETILQEVRSQSNLKAITDMWTNMNVASRLDAAEEGIRKLSSLIEDLIAETSALENKLNAMPAKKEARTAAPGVAPTAAPGVAPTAAPGVAPTAAPGVAPTAAPGVAPTAAPGAAPTPAPGVALTAAPGVAPTTAPGVAPTAVPGVAPAAAPGVAPTTARGVAPTAAPGVAPTVVAPSAAPSVQAPFQAGVTPSATDRQSLSAMDLDYLATKDELGQVLDYCATKDELGQVLEHLQTIRDELDQLVDTFYDALKDVNPAFEQPEPHPKSVIVISPSQPPSAPISRIQQITQAPPPPSAPAAPPGRQVPPASQARPGPQAPPYPQARPGLQAPPYPQGPQQGPPTAQVARLQERMAELENELRKCCDGFKKNEGRIQDLLSSFQDQLDYMAKQIAVFTTQGEGGKLSPDLIKDLQALMKLFETVQSMQTQLQQVHETALNLAAEKEARQNHIDALLEQIELLKVIKLDREDMVEALADKADLRMLARKVSHDQFENACDDLSKGLEHALGKLNVQESLWQQALDDIQREIEQKLDKMELSPVKEFFNNKLKQLQENLRQMASLRREAEAAGTKRRLLRDVNCISCDANAVMQSEAPPPQASKPLPAHLSMKPYLTYELDAIRKTQANVIPQRNMHDWEHVQHQMLPSRPHKVRSETDKHLCNRYCGGSHTTTTPAQRVARLGHFMKQWGPEVLPLSSGFAAGDDGRLYKVSTSEGANVGPGGAVEGAAVCTPKSPVKKQDAKPHVKPVEITAECRCLDPTAGRPPSQA